MRSVKLILLEGMPGAGKSTLAQGVERKLELAGVAARWWYEEELGHPVYCFRDLVGLRRVVADLGNGRHGRVIQAALATWREFAASVAARDEVVVLDGCLYGYLTWSLFPFGVSEAEILDYVAEVAAILRAVQPCVVYIRPDDVASSWRRLFAARGAVWAESAVARATTSAYGERNGLVGFEGLVAYWQAYQRLVDEAFARLPLTKLTLGLGEGQASFLPTVLEFLGVEVGSNAVVLEEGLARYVGSYLRRDGGAAAGAQVALRDGTLSLAGVPELWTQNRLLPVGKGEFAVEAFPFRVKFGDDAPGLGTQMAIEGPELLGGVVAGRYAREA